MTLEERITRLEDIESIRTLQSKYQRCLDNRDFDTLASCFTEDAISSYDSNKMNYVGKDNIIKFLSDVMDIKMISTHLIHGSEIDIIDNINAKAIWYLEDHLVHQRYLVKLHGAANYHVEYKKIDGKWYISKIGYERVYEYVEVRGLINLFTLHKKTILNKIKTMNYDSLDKYNKYYHDKSFKKKRK